MVRRIRRHTVNLNNNQPPRLGVVRWHNDYHLVTHHGALLRLNMTTANKVLEIAASQIGYAEGKNNDNKFSAAYGKNHVQWCGWFVKWVFDKAGLKIPNPAYTPAGAEGFKSIHAWHEKGTPKPGDCLFMDFPSDDIHRISHVGICVRMIDDNHVLTIEGNTSTGGDQRNGGEVQVKVRPMSVIVGWGRPRFEPAPITVKIEPPVAKKSVPTTAKKSVAPAKKVAKK